jgi:hypothetical protein
MSKSYWPTPFTWLTLFFLTVTVALSYVVSDRFSQGDLASAYGYIIIEAITAAIAIYTAWVDHVNLMFHIAHRHDKKQLKKKHAR